MIMAEQVKDRDIQGDLDKLVSLGKKKGFLTYDEVNETLSDQMDSSEEISLAKRIEEAEIKFAESLFKTYFARKEAIAMINAVLKEEINAEDVIKDELERRGRLIKDLSKILEKVRHTRVGSDISSKSI